MKLKGTNVDAIKLPKGKRDHIEFDDDLHGFGLRVREGGSRTYVVQYKIGTQQRRMTIGAAKTLTFAQARTAAKSVLAKVELGQDPQGDKAVARATAGETFKAVAGRFLERQEKRLRESSYYATHLYLMTHLKPLHALKFDKIGRAQIAARLGAIADNSGAVSADRARAALSALFTWAMKEGLCESNPVIATNTFSNSGSRERVLSDQELAAIWLALPDNDYGRIVKLLALTGTRREEIAGLRWSEVDLQNRVLDLPGSRTKNKRPFVIPLSETAHNILAGIPRRDGRDLIFGKGAGGFQGWTKSKKELDAKLASMTGWTLHDLRRTASTGMNELGVEPHVVEACLNHVSGHRAGIAGTYNKAAYKSQKAAALDTWAHHVSVIVAQASGANVQSMRGR